MKERPQNVTKHNTDCPDNLFLGDLMTVWMITILPENAPVARSSSLSSSSMTLCVGLAEEEIQLWKVAACVLKKRRSA